MVDQLGFYLKILCQGLPVTLSLSFSAIICACLLSIFLTILLTSKNRFLQRLINGYILVFTGTPLLVQIFLIYYGSAQFSQLQNYCPIKLKGFCLIVWSLLSYPWFSAFLALTLNSAAYTTQLFYGALKAIPEEQWQACAVLGMNKQQTLKVILPYALKRALSTYSNEVIFVVKGTALVSTITLLDVMGYNQFLMGNYYDFSIFILTGMIYLLINGLLSLMMRIIEKKALIFEE